MTRTRGLGFYKNSDIYSGSTNEQIQVVTNRSHMIRPILYGAHIKWVIFAIARICSLIEPLEISEYL